MSGPRNLSQDPSVVTHADGTQTFTPGMFRRKLAAFLFGCAVLAFGVYWQAKPAWLLLRGETTEARVAYVLEVKPGQEPVKHDTRKAVAEAEDPTRNATFLYHVRFTTAAGRTVTAPLNYGQAHRPIHSVNDPIPIAYDPDNPEDLIDRWSVRTWAFGFFFMGIGVFIAIPQWFLLRAANRPIVLDQILDYDDVVRNAAGGAPADGKDAGSKGAG